MATPASGTAAGQLLLGVPLPPPGATAVGGVPEPLQGGAGVLVPPREPAALADALGRVLGSAAIRAALARAGRRRVAEEFEVTLPSAAEPASV